MNLVVIIVVITVGISLLAWSSSAIMSALLFRPYSIKNFREYYRFLTSGFIHANFIHLFVNMFVLYNFGTYVMQYFEGITQVDGMPVSYAKSIYYFISMYLGGMIVANLPSYVKQQKNTLYASLGASGAVSAVLFSFILMDPLEKIFIFFIPIGIPAIFWGVFYLIYEYYSGTRQRDNVNHDAHIFGAIFGIVFTIAIHPAIVPDFFQQITNAWS
jgi:membrane associated rhomboid family serine protease